MAIIGQKMIGKDSWVELDGLTVTSPQGSSVTISVDAAKTYQIQNKGFQPCFVCDTASTPTTENAVFLSPLFTDVYQPETGIKKYYKSTGNSVLVVSSN